MNAEEKKMIEKINKNPIMKAVRSYTHGQVSFTLFWLFNDFKTINIKDSGLLADIELCQRVINEIETMRVSKVTNKKDFTYMSYRQDRIHELSEVLQKCPLRISVDFYQYAKSGAKHAFEESIVRLSNITKDVKQLRKKQSLPNLGFYASFPEGIPPADSDESIRVILTAGLFDYLNRLIHKKPYRPRRCKSCGLWYLAARSDSDTCSSKCKEAYWRKYMGGRAKRREGMRKLRSSRST